MQKTNEAAARERERYNEQIKLLEQDIEKAYNDGDSDTLHQKHVALNKAKEALQDIPDISQEQQQELVAFVQSFKKENQHVFADDDRADFFTIQAQKLEQKTAPQTIEEYEDIFEQARVKTLKAFPVQDKKPAAAGIKSSNKNVQGADGFNQLSRQDQNDFFEIIAASSKLQRGTPEFRKEAIKLYKESIGQ